MDAHRGSAAGDPRHFRKRGRTNQRRRRTAPVPCEGLLPEGALHDDDRPGGRGRQHHRHRGRRGYRGAAADRLGHRERQAGRDLHLPGHRGPLAVRTRTRRRKKSSRGSAATHRLIKRQARRGRGPAARPRAPGRRATGKPSARISTTSRADGSAPSTAKPRAMPSSSSQKPLASLRTPSIIQAKARSSGVMHHDKRLEQAWSSERLGSSARSPGASERPPGDQSKKLRETA